MRNTLHLEKDRVMRAAKLQAFLCPSAVENMEKDRKLKDFYFSSVCEEDESPCTLGQCTLGSCICNVSMHVQFQIEDKKCDFVTFEYSSIINHYNG